MFLSLSCSLFVINAFSFPLSSFTLFFYPTTPLHPPLNYIPLHPSVSILCPSLYIFYILCYFLFCGHNTPFISRLCLSHCTQAQHALSPSNSLGAVFVFFRTICLFDFHCLIFLNFCLSLVPFFLWLATCLARFPAGHTCSSSRAKIICNTGIIQTNTHIHTCIEQ